MRCCQCQVKRFGTDEHGMKGGVCLNGDGEGSERPPLEALRLEHSVNVQKLVINSV